VTDRDAEALRAELARVEQAYIELSATFALAKAEAGLDPNEDYREQIQALAARRDALAGELRDAGRLLDERAGGPARRPEPQTLSLYTLGLPHFTETSVDWQDGRLTVCRRRGQDEREAEVRPTPAEWERFWSVLDASRAWEWAGSHEGGGLDGVEWSLEVGHGGKRLRCHGRNAYPTGFDTVVAALDKLVGGVISRPLAATPVSQVAERVCHWDLLVFDYGAKVLPRLMDELRGHGGDASRVVGTAHALGRLAAAGLPAWPLVLDALGQVPGLLASPPAEPRCHDEIRETLLTLLRCVGVEAPGARGGGPAD